MQPFAVAVLVVLALCVGFVLGVVFHKLAIDREQSLKTHITNELTDLKGVLLGEAGRAREVLNAAAAKFPR